MKRRSGIVSGLLAFALLSLLAFADVQTPSPKCTDDGFILVDSLDELRRYADQPNVKIRLMPGAYTLDRASSREFIVITGRNSRWDLTGVKLRVDTALFRQFDGRGLYCVFALAGDDIEFQGVTTENFGDHAGLQSRNKIFNITGSRVVLRNVDLTTSGSSPWGYGSLYGLSGPDVRKMNGIRVGWPARGVRLIGCRVHMRAMGHGIFVQGAQNTRIEDCHVDGLLRRTDNILTETSGFAFDRKFIAHGSLYSEGVALGADGGILPGELIALSEDGIRLYDRAGVGQPTGSTTIINCTVTRMRRGICTGLGSAADTIVNCDVHECIAAGFNLGSGDVLQRSRADARYAEALCIPYVASRNVTAELELLDSREGLANDLVAVINGVNHDITLTVSDPASIPSAMSIELATRRGYAHYQRSEPLARNIRLKNHTPARVVLTATAIDNEITSGGVSP